jgi:hypothetical protein
LQITYQRKTAGNYHFVRKKKYFLKWCYLSWENRKSAIPIAVSVVTGKQAEQAGAFNVNRVKELIPGPVASSILNTGINIRGLGSPYGLTNDGIDPGVGFVDGVRRT